MQRKTLSKEIAAGIAATLVGFAILEALIRIAYFVRNSMVDYIPVVYDMRDEYGVAPPWLDAFRILERNKVLLWKNRSNVQRRYLDVFTPINTEEERVSLRRQFYPRIPDLLKANPTWEISLNAEGFRDVEFAKTKSVSTFRIICLGDSWTFGANVDQKNTYPRQLMAMLNHDFPQGNFEVLNLGVMGYSSYQGLELMRQSAINLNPDVVVIGFGMNDSRVAGYRDKDLSRRPALSTDWIHQSLEGIESYKLLRYLALVLKSKPTSVGDRLKAEAESARTGDDVLARRKHFGKSGYEKVESWTRVSLSDYENNLLEMINLARNQRAGVILLYNELWAESPYRTVLEQISRTQGVPFVNSSALIVAAQRKIEEELEQKLDLRPHKPQRGNPDGEIEVIFRLFADKWSVPKAMYIVGNHPKLGNLVPNKIAMYDDGTHGDQKAGDHVWSYSATFSPGTSLFYVYTNSGEEGKWEGLDVPHIRSFTVEAKNGEQKLYRPIESFGKIYMYADPWHTNAVGYQLIARALLDTLKKNEQAKDYLRQAK